MRAIILALAMTTAAPALAQSSGSPLIDFAGFQALASEVRPYRSTRLISLQDFNARAQRNSVLILDARSAQAFREGHINGAVNLPLPDFTAEALARVIGSDVDRPILIYCNNNFTNNLRPIITKVRPLALNIQTFINLYGYGYKNVWELGEAVDMHNPAVGWVSSGK